MARRSPTDEDGDNVAFERVLLDKARGETFTLSPPLFLKPLFLLHRPCSLLSPRLPSRPAIDSCGASICSYGCPKVFIVYALVMVRVAEAVDDARLMMLDTIVALGFRPNVNIVNPAVTRSVLIGTRRVCDCAVCPVAVVDLVLHRMACIRNSVSRASSGGIVIVQEERPVKALVTGYVGLKWVYKPHNGDDQKQQGQADDLALHF